MQPLLEHAAIAWNPIGQARRRLHDGTLTAGEVFVPFIGIVIACNLVTAGGQSLFFDSLFQPHGSEAPNDPFVTCDFSQRVLSAWMLDAGCAMHYHSPHADRKGR